MHTQNGQCIAARHFHMECDRINKQKMEKKNYNKLKAARDNVLKILYLIFL